MREVLTLQIGNCGCHVGLKFWELISDEHGINPTTGVFEGQSDLQIEKLDVYYQETSSGRYVPRSIMVDTNYNNIESIKNSCVAKMYRPEGLISGQTGSSHNFGKGFNMVRTHEGHQLMETVIDRIYSELEICDNLQAIQVAHSVAGGTGSGMGSFILQSLRDIVGKEIIATFTHVPTATLPEAVVEPYNTMLSIPYLEKIADMTFLFDNEALFSILTSKLGLSQPTYSDANYLVATVMSSISASIRFPGQVNMSMRKLLTNMTPQPTLHYFTTAIGPLSNACSNSYMQDNVKLMAHSVLEPKNMFSACNYKDGVYIAIQAMFRGPISSNVIINTMHNIHKQHPKLFSNILYHCISLGLCDIPPRTNNKNFATFVVNHTSIVDVISNVNNQINNMFPQRKAFFHWFEEEFITENDLKMAAEIANEVIENYEFFEVGTEAEKP